MDGATLNSIPQILKVLWDSLSTKKSASGLNTKEFLINRILSILTSELNNKKLNHKRSISELNKIILDIMKLRRTAINMSPTERKMLFCAFLLAIALVLFPYEDVKVFIRRMTE